MNPASRFFSALFGRYPVTSEELRLEIRPLLPEWAKADLSQDVVLHTHRAVRRWYCLSPEYLQNATAYAESLASEFDVYYGVLPREGKSGSQDGVSYACCLFADVDGGGEGVPGAIARIKEAAIDLPDIAICSGGGIHCYWLLDAPLPLPDRESRESFKRTLRRLCIAIGGVSPAAHADSSACEVARILRVPGTFNHKRQDEPRAVKMLRNVRYSPDHAPLCRSYDWWGAHLPVEQQPIVRGPRAQPSPYTPIGTLTPGLSEWAKRGYPEGKRHQDFVSAAAWLIRDVKLHKADAVALLRVKAQNSPGHRVITDEEIEAMLKWA